MHFALCTRFLFSRYEIQLLFQPSAARARVHEFLGDLQRRFVDRNEMAVDDWENELECAEVLEKAGARKVNAYATHPSFPQKSWRKFIGRNVKLYLTNSCPEVIEEMQKYFVSGADLEIISLAPAIATEIINWKNRKRCKI